MKGIQTKFNISMAVIIVVYALLLIITNVGYTSVPVATVSGSYASNFANEKHLENLSLADTQKMYFDIRYEDFDYNIKDDGTLIIEGYKGQSSSLIIPGIIDGKIVTELGDMLFENTSVKDIYVAPTVSALPEKTVDSVVIHADAKAMEGFKEAGWKTEEILDSDFVNFLEGENPFDYNDLGNGIDIAGYKGKSDLVVIPSYINGKPVTSISMDMLKGYSGIVIPETVTNITGRVGKLLYGAGFAIEFVFTLLSFLLTLIVVNIALPKIKKDISEIVLTSPQIVLSYLYVIVQVVFGLLVIYKGITTPLIALVVSAVLMVAYILYIFMASVGRTYEKEVEQHIEESTSKMREIKASVVGLADGIEDKEVKKQIDRVAEAVKYMPMHTKNDEDNDCLMERISNLKTIVASAERDRIIKECNSIIALIEKR